MVSHWEGPVCYTLPLWCAEAEAPACSRIPPWFWRHSANLLLSLWKFQTDSLQIRLFFLSAISFLKRVGDLQALSAALHMLSLRLAWLKLFCIRDLGIFLKYPPPFHSQLSCRPSVLLPFWDPDQQKLNCKCEHWTYTSTKLPCGESRTNLFVKKGLYVTKQTLSRWIVDAISSAYESSDLTSPLGVRALFSRKLRQITF